MLLSLLAACTTREQAEANMRQRRLSCEFKAGALPQETVGDQAFLGKKMPVDHIVLMMQENRSFDHYFSGLTHGGVDVAGDDVALVGSDGVVYPRHHEDALCLSRDITHSWDGSHKQWNDGANDGFARAAGNPDAGRALAYYDESDIPYYYGLARTFAISDAHHASLLGPTWPNRMFYTAGTSFGRVKNELPPTDEDSGVNNIFEELAKKKVSFKVYISDAPTMILYIHTYAKFSDRVLPLQQFFVDAAEGNLPQFSMVEAKYAAESERDDEHPPHNLQRGQRFTADAVNALLASPAWKRSILFLTWDEHGGFYDHVPPPPGCAPDDIAPNIGTETAEGKFDRLGFRVPLIAISPFAKRGHVSHYVSDLTSVTRFVEMRFDLPAMTARDANAEPLLDLFDFEHPSYDVPVLPEAVIEADRDCDFAR